MCRCLAQSRACRETWGNFSARKSTTCFYAIHRCLLSFQELSTSWIQHNKTLSLLWQGLQVVCRWSISARPLMKTSRGSCLSRDILRIRSENSPNTSHSDCTPTVWFLTSEMPKRSLNWVDLSRTNIPSRCTSTLKRSSKRGKKNSTWSVTSEKSRAATLQLDLPLSLISSKVIKQEAKI